MFLFFSSFSLLLCQLLLDSKPLQNSVTSRSHHLFSCMSLQVGWGQTDWSWLDLARQCCFKARVPLGLIPCYRLGSGLFHTCLVQAAGAVMAKAEAQETHSSAQEHFKPLTASCLPTSHWSKQIILLSFRTRNREGYIPYVPWSQSRSHSQAQRQRGWEAQSFCVRVGRLNIWSIIESTPTVKRIDWVSISETHYLCGAALWYKHPGSSVPPPRWPSQSAT